MVSERPRRADERRPSHLPDAISNWGAASVATVEANGSDLRSALEGALCAALSLIVAISPKSSVDERAAPIRGEGDDREALFIDLIEDLQTQLTEFSACLSDVTLDGVLRRDDGGYIAWGYVTGALKAPNLGRLPTLVPIATSIADDGQRVVIRTSLRWE